VKTEANNGELTSGGLTAEALWKAQIIIIAIPAKRLGVSRLS